MMGCVLRGIGELLVFGYMESADWWE